MFLNFLTAKNGWSASVCRCLGFASCAAMKLDIINSETDLYVFTLFRDLFLQFYAQ
jgi:hypothetical protein